MIQETERAGQVAHVELKPPPAPFSASQRELAKCLADCGVCGTDAHAMISDVSMKSGYTYESPLDEIESSVMGKMKEIFSIFKAKKPEPDADDQLSLLAHHRLRPGKRDRKPALHPENSGRNKEDEEQKRNVRHRRGRYFVLGPDPASDHFSTFRDLRDILRALASRSSSNTSTISPYSLSG